MTTEQSEHMGGSINAGASKWMVYIGKFHLEVAGNWGYPKSGNSYISESPKMSKACHLSVQAWTSRDCWNSCVPIGCAKRWSSSFSSGVLGACTGKMSRLVTSPRHGDPQHLSEGSEDFLLNGSIADLLHLESQGLDMA